MSEESYNDDLGEVDWIRIPNFPYVMKYKVDENGYIMMISDLTVVYGEKLNEKSVQEKFQTLNPYAEMRSKVILKHLKQNLEDIMAGEFSNLQIDPDIDSLTIHLKFNVNEVFFIFDLEPRRMASDKVRAHVIAPILLMALILNEENVALKKKIQESDKKDIASSFSTRSSIENQKVKNFCSGINKKSGIAVTDAIDAFLYLQKNKVCLPESLKDTKMLPEKSKVTDSSCASTSLNKSVKDKKNMPKDLLYDDEDDFEVNLFASDVWQKSLVPQKREIETADLAPSTRQNENTEQTLPVKKEHKPSKKKKPFQF